jgi:hypothetical protein
MPGPPPKRQAERRRRNKTTESGASNEAETLVVSHADMEDTTLVKAPAPNPHWHPLARMQYEAAKRSAMRELYEPTDWAQLFVLCQTLSDHLSEQFVGFTPTGEIIREVQAMNGSTLAAILKGFSSLMFAEGDRRRLRLEVERRAAGHAAAAAPTGETVSQTRQTRLTVVS